MTIVINDEACRGCRICELACSFHHKRVFSPGLSSIRVSRNNRNGKIECFINSTCDYCSGEEQPFCVKYCLYGVLTEAKGK